MTHDEYLLLLWDRHLDTFAIAELCGITEAEADRRVWRALEQRRITKHGVKS